MEETLLDELRNLGKEDDFQLDMSFGKLCHFSPTNLATATITKLKQVYCSKANRVLETLKPMTIQSIVVTLEIGYG